MQSLWGQDSFHSRTNQQVYVQAAPTHEVLLQQAGLLPWDYDCYLLHPELSLETSCATLTQPDPTSFNFWELTRDYAIALCDILNICLKYLHKSWWKSAFCLFGKREARYPLFGWTSTSFLKYMSQKMSQNSEFPLHLISTYHHLIFLCFRMKINPKKWDS